MFAPEMRASLAPCYFQEVFVFFFFFFLMVRLIGVTLVNEDSLGSRCKGLCCHQLPFSLETEAVSSGRGPSGLGTSGRRLPPLRPNLPFSARSPLPPRSRRARRSRMAALALRLEEGVCCAGVQRRASGVLHSVPRKEVLHEPGCVSASLMAGAHRRCSLFSLLLVLF